MVMTIAERLRQEGRQEGRQEAMQQGIGLVLAVFDKFGQSSETKIVVSMIKNIYEADVLAKLEKKLNETNSIENFKEAVFLES
jgi:bifunctional DNase/RNase